MWHSRPPRDPTPLHGKCHLKFPFWFLTPSLMKLHWYWFWRGPPRPSGPCWSPHRAFVTCPWVRYHVHVHGATQCSHQVTSVLVTSPQLGKSVLYLTHQRVENLNLRCLGNDIRRLLALHKIHIKHILVPLRKEKLLPGARYIDYLIVIILPLQSFLSKRCKLQRMWK